MNRRQKETVILTLRREIAQLEQPASPDVGSVSALIQLLGQMPRNAQVRVPDSDNVGRIVRGAQLDVGDITGTAYLILSPCV